MLISAIALSVGKETMKFFEKRAPLLGAAALTFVLAGSASAQDAVAPAAGPDTAYIFNTLLFMIGGVLVMFMAAGFAMLEAGLVRGKNVSMQCLKNISIYSIAGLMYWWIGYNLMYTNVAGGYFGSFSLLGYGFDPVGGNALKTGYSTASDWFFQMVFVATAASIVSVASSARVSPRVLLATLATKPSLIAISP